MNRALDRFNTATWTFAGIGLCVLAGQGFLSIIPYKETAYVSFPKSGKIKVQLMGTSCELVREGRALHIVIHKRGALIEAVCVEYDDVKGKIL